MAADLLNPMFLDEELAREHLEALRWANGRVCAHCGVINESGAVNSKSTEHKGLYYCNACGKTFTVTVGTLFERSHVPLNKWLMAFHLMAASKKGMSAKQLERMLGVTYKTAWFMAHRIREAMKSDNSTLLGGPGSSGIVEVDETYWGRNNVPLYNDKQVGPKHKMMVVSLVERQGDKRSFHITGTYVNAATVGPILKAQVAQSARLMSDEHRSYRTPGKYFASHETVSHGTKEYARGDVTSNTVESSFAILKRGLTGTFHSVSEKHLQRYCTEFDFRWNTRQSRGFTDSMRAAIALKGIEGKRLTYRRIGSQQEANA
jgi:transposase-like protein